ncbi:hypothetical protein K8352_12340 [Flavobacteriaceae bacterium F89]|uniref:Uncharacterized protein n=1 Tax=Cerina litoralis TaxID=2874477 RepID=A0AAE3EXS3_9FLAO|nr:hypothetical protein [Cerina litoralis]MCG2461541.1 hypothetical protein [Cerina litoralis]
MTIDFPDSQKLLSNAKKAGLFDNLVVQLQKDFILANIAIDFVGGGEVRQITPEELMSVLREKVYRLIMEKFTDYLNLLYIVDVPEKAFKEIQLTDVVEIAEQVTLLILKREYQKVRLKAQFGQEPNI